MKLRLVVLSITLALSAAVAGRAAAAVPMPKTELTRMHAVYASLWLPSWLPSGFVFVDWRKGRSPSNRSLGYDLLTVEFGDAGAVIEWRLSGYSGVCARQNYAPSGLLPVSRYKGPASFAPGAYGSFYGRTGYYLPGNHTQLAWTCAGHTLIDLVVDGMPATAAIRAVTSARLIG